LKGLQTFRHDLTLISGFSHPDPSGADGHSSEQSWLTVARHPVLGGFRHGQYLAFDSNNNRPLCNLFVQMIQSMGIETRSFGSSTGESLLN
jgi:hypothetical protein